MLWICLYTLLELVNFYLVYRVIFRAQFCKKKWLYALVLLGACFIQMLICFSKGEIWRDTIAWVCGIGATLLLVEKRRVKNLLLFPIIVFISSIVNIIGAYGIGIMTGISAQVVCDDVVLTCIAECTGIIVFGICGLVRNGFQKDEVILSLGQYIILLLGTCVLFFMIAFSQALMFEEQFPERLKDGLAIATVVFAVLFVILSLWQQVTWKKAYQYRMDNEKYELFLMGQERNIRMLIEEDEKRRKLKHDMKAHMLALSTMIQRNDTEAIRVYLSEMQDVLSAEQMERYTAISAVDAVIDEWLQEALRQDIAWTWDGSSIRVSNISIFELCTLFSNLLSNAVEACEHVKQDRKIDVKCTSFQEKLVIVVGNTCDEAVQVEDVLKGSTKADNVYHGLGHKNVEEIINKHGGKIEYTAKNGWFEVTILV